MEIFLFVLAAFFIVGYDFLSRYKGAPVHCDATVVDKKIKKAGSRRTAKNLYYLFFKTEDGTEIKLKTDGIDYERFDIGDFGKLNYSGEMLLKFEKKDR